MRCPECFLEFDEYEDEDEFIPFCSYGCAAESAERYFYMDEDRT